MIEVAKVEKSTACLSKFHSDSSELVLIVNSLAKHQVMGSLYLYRACYKKNDFLKVKDKYVNIFKH